MSLDKVETFEKDIASEILKKEASISKVAAADSLVEEVSNEVNPPKKESRMSSAAILMVSVVVVLILAGAGAYFGYSYYMDNKPVTSSSAKNQAALPKQNAFATTFPDLNADLGGYVTQMDKNPFGYVITFNDYTPVFSYTVKHEDALAKAIARALPTGDIVGDSFTFNDVTISNVTMRVGEAGSTTVAYAFIGTNKLIISTSSQGISSIAGILK